MFVSKKFYKAQRTLPDRPVPSTELVFEVELPHACIVEEMAIGIYEGEAREIAKALRDVLPGGVFDRLVCELLEMKASRLRIAYGPSEERKQS